MLVALVMGLVGGSGSRFGFFAAFVEAVPAFVEAMPQCRSDCFEKL